MQLRLYCITSTGDQGLSVEVYPDVFSLQDWFLKKGQDVAAGILLHIGHDRPTDNNQLEDLIARYPGRILGTEPCRWSLPRDYRFSSEPVSEVALDSGAVGCKVYLMTQGFECFLNDADLGVAVGLPPPSSSAVDMPTSVPGYDGWLGHCVVDNPSIADVLLGSGIDSTADFDLRSGEIPYDALKLLKNYQDWFSQRKESADVAARILRAHPSFRRIELQPYLRTVRLENVFDRHSIRYVGDLLRYSDEQLGALQNFGRTSLIDLHASLDDILKAKRSQAGFSQSQGQFPEPLGLPINSDWIASYLKEHSANQGIFEELKIFNDVDYQDRRSALPESVRDEADGFRFSKLIDTVSIHDPVRIVSICPDWLLKQPIDALDVSVRVRNVLHRMQLATVEDLLKTTSEDLKGQRNFGGTSLRGLSNALLHAVKTKSASCFRSEGLQHITLRQHLQQALDELKIRTREIICARFGVGCPRGATLDEVAATHRLTRERIRQIVKKVIEAWTRSKLWGDLLAEKLDALTRGRESPLLLDLLPVEDRWFEGFSDEPHVLSALIEEFASDRFHIYLVNQVNVITTLSKPEWEDIVSEGNAWIRDIAEPHKATKAEVTNHLSEICRAKNAGEFEGFLLERCLENLHFAIDATGVERLVGIGRSAEILVRAVLEESASPLHFHEIHKRCEQRSGRELDVRRVSNACHSGEGILLFGRGTYGVSRHLSVPDSVGTLVREICEEVISSGQPGRQWHCRELLEEVEEQLDPVNLNTYVLDLLLMASRCLSSLGRQVWVLRGDKAISTEDRALIHGLALRALHEAGRPLKNGDLLNEIGKIRGIRANYQLQPTEHLIRIEPNVWGLTARDIPASVEEWRALQERMYSLLKARERSLHHSEFSNYDDALRRPLGITDYLTYSICKMDKRFHCWSGGLLGLEEWGEARGLTVPEAFHRIVESLSSPQTLLEIHQHVERMVGRKVDKLRISQLLAQSSCQWDPQEELWFLPSEEIF